MSGRERPAPHCRPPRKPTRNEVQRATTSDGDCCDGGEDSNGEDSNRDSEDSNGDGEDSNGDGSGNGSGNDELQRRRAVHFSTPGQKPPQAKQNARPVRRKIQQIGRIPRPENPSGELRSPPVRDGFSPPVAHKFRRQPIAARVLHAVKAMEERRFGKLSESGDMN
jgi:hypothetical protein